MNIQAACEALRAKRCLEVRYDGYSRVVEVHACGYTSNNNAVMRVWQVRGSVSGEREGWKLLRLDETRGLHMLDEVSRAPRRGFKRGDTAMARTVCQVDGSGVG